MVFEFPIWTGLRYILVVTGQLQDLGAKVIIVIGLTGDQEPMAPNGPFQIFDIQFQLDFSL